MENLKLMSDKKKTAELIWESWIVDSTEPDPEECTGPGADDGLVQRRVCAVPLRAVRV